MYHVAVDNQTPYWVYGNRQDNGTMRGPSTAPEGATANARHRRGAWPWRAWRRTGRRLDHCWSWRTGTNPARVDAARGAAGAATRSHRRRWQRCAARLGERGFDRRRRGGGGGGFSTWDHGLGGCESGFTLPDLTDTEHRVGKLLRRTR